MITFEYVGGVSLTPAQRRKIGAEAFERAVHYYMQLRIVGEDFSAVSMRRVFKSLGLKPSKSYLIYFRSKGWIAGSPVPYLYSIYQKDSEWGEVLRQKRFKRLTVRRLDDIVKLADILFVNREEGTYYLADAKYTEKDERRLYSGDILRLYVYRELLKKYLRRTYFPTFVVSTESFYVPGRFSPSFEEKGIVTHVTVEKPVRFTFSVLPFPRVVKEPIRVVVHPYNAYHVFLGSRRVYTGRYR